MFLCPMRRECRGLGSRVAVKEDGLTVLLMSNLESFGWSREDFEVLLMAAKRMLPPLRF